MLNKISFHGKPIIHDYYPVEETARDIAKKAKKLAEEAYTRFDGINKDVKVKDAIKTVDTPEAGANIHLKTEDLVKQLESEAKDAVDSANSVAAVDKYEQFSSF